MASPNGRAAQARDRSRRAEQQAVHLRALGRTYDQIAASPLPCNDYHAQHPEPGCPACLPLYANRAGAKLAVDRTLEREYAAGSDTREALRRQQLAQIDLILGPAMQRALDGGDQVEAAVTSCVRLLDRRAKLLGLDAPLRIERTSDLDAQVEALVEQLASEAQQTAAARLETTGTHGT